MSFDNSGDTEKMKNVKITEIIIKMKNVAVVALKIRLFRLTTDSRESKVLNSSDLRRRNNILHYCQSNS